MIVEKIARFRYLQGDGKKEKTPIHRTKKKRRPASLTSKNAIGKGRARPGWGKKQKRRIETGPL